MALTNIDTIKSLIQSFLITIPNILNERIQFELFEASQLEHTNIDNLSETVKIIRDALPLLDVKSPITLTDQDPVSLTSQKIVWDTVIVSNTLSLTTIYVENDDYIIDYTNGTITRTTTGTTIPNGGTIYIWYLPFTILTSGSDYNINYDFGTLTRRAGSSIPNNATIYVDYSHSQATVTDTSLLEIIDEMEHFVKPRLKSGFTLDSDDAGLKSAATNFCLYLFCLSQSLKELHVAGKDDSDKLASQWMKLSDKYLDTANVLFSKYLKTTTKQLGGIIQNRFTTSRKKVVTSPTINARIRRH